MFGRLGERRPHDLLQDEVAESTSAVPALEPFLGHDSGGSSTRVHSEGLEPSDPREAVSRLSSPLRIPEVRDERGDGVVVQPERREPGTGFLARHRERS